MLLVSIFAVARRCGLNIGLFSVHFCLFIACKYRLGSVDYLMAPGCVFSVSVPCMHASSAIGIQHAGLLACHMSYIEMPMYCETCY